MRNLEMRKLEMRNKEDNKGSKCSKNKNSEPDNNSKGVSGVENIQAFSYDGTQRMSVLNDELDLKIKKTNVFKVYFLDFEEFFIEFKGLNEFYLNILALNIN
jgi:hypothetical protein